MIARRLSGGAAESIPAMEWAAVVLPATQAAAVPLYGAPAATPGQTESAESLRREVEGKADEAYRRGYQEGQSAAARAAQAEIQTRVEQLTRAVEAIGAYRAKIRAEAERDLVELSIGIARRLVHREIQTDPEALLGLVKAALERTDAGEIHRLRLAPAHAEIVRKNIDRSGRKMEVAADAALAPGEAILETTRGRIEAGIDAQLREIERGFADLLP